MKSRYGPGGATFPSGGALPEAFARWLQEQNKDRPIRWEKVEPRDEQILPDRELESWETLATWARRT
jgi:hypothetical protein